MSDIVEDAGNVFSALEADLKSLVARVEALEAKAATKAVVVAGDAKADVVALETKVRAALKSMGGDVVKFFDKL
jgi:ElaB/YqjD/DUF883 family membrane-anchored ribosome-binding protein